jgi:hypothetical protein
MSIHMDSQAPTEERAQGDLSVKALSEDCPACEVRRDDNTIDCEADNTSIRPSNFFIEDIVDWKARLLCGPASRPVDKLVVASQ